MDANQFDIMFRGSEDRSRRGALQAITALGIAGVLDRLSVMTAQAKKKKGDKKKKKDQKTCPQCPQSICAPPDTCPQRICCDCNEFSPHGAGCRFSAFAPTTADIAAVCGSACGGAGKWASGTPSDAANAVMCREDGNRCVRVRCPI